MNKPKAFEAFEKRGITPRGDRWDAICPAHEDSRKSLTIGIGNNGSVLLTCHAGCKVRAIVEALGLKMGDLWPDGAANWSSGPIAEPPRLVAEYNYTDEDGVLLYQVQRLDPKGFRQRRFMHAPLSRWIYVLGDVRRVLYGLPELIAKPDAIAFIVEGEKDVHSLRALGFVATTVAGGAGGWAKHADEYAAQIGNREVVILPDNDKAGRQFAADIRATLPRALVVNLPVAEKGDVSDWIATRGATFTKSDLVNLVLRCAANICNRAKKTFDTIEVSL